MSVRFLPVVQPRSCGSCTLCCKVLGITELGKKAGTWCRHALSKRGCGIYAARPSSCASFRCLWLDGLSGDDQRPDRVHGVLSTSNDGAHVVLHEDPGYRGSARRRLRPYLDKLTADGKHACFVVCGAERVILGRADLVTQLAREASQHTALTVTMHDSQPTTKE